MHHHKSNQDADRRFGLRIENHLLRVAIATPGDGGGYDIDIDAIHCDRPDGWLNPAARDDLVAGLTELVERHGMRRHQVVASLDGDFCVTRITTGNPREVDAELETLATRIPRYLQLGPGEKVTGSSRSRLEPMVDYAITGVANRTVVEAVYDAFRASDLEVSWLEPSLNSLSRLVGHAGLCQEAPVLIADGTGRQWDVGIAHEGRLLLDYRPAAANTDEGFRAALENHLQRLRRFCQRHRRLKTGELQDLLLCGSTEKSQRAVNLFDESRNIRASILEIPEIAGLYRVAESARRHGASAAVATVLPLLIGTPVEEVPDLFDHVRRAPDLSPTSRALRMSWPVVAAMSFLAISFALVSHQRRLVASVDHGRQIIQDQVRLTQVRMSKLAARRELIDHLVVIEKATDEPLWDQTIRHITQSLPDEAKLNSFHVEAGDEILLDGSVTEELMVYDLVGSLRKLPGISQVALKATNPGPQGSSIRFLIGLTMAGRQNAKAEEASSR